MIKKNQKILSMVFILIIFLLPLTVLGEGATPLPAGITGMLNDAAGPDGAGYDTGIDEETGLASIAGIIIRAVLSLLGVVFVSLIIYGGFLWMIARGNEEEITKAKSILKSSIIGLIITLSAFAIYSFVSSALMGGSIGGEAGTSTS